MKIKDVEIKNFRSLKDIKMENIGGFCVLIGCNSSGKSNFLEALHLFFNELDSQVSRNIGGLPDLLWFKRISSTPIIFDITLKLSKDDVRDVLPEKIQSFLDIRDENTLTIRREIKGPHTSASWKTSYIKFNDGEIMEDGEILILEDQIKNIPVEEGQPPLTSDQLLGQILQQISNGLKEKFKILYATRDYTVTPSRLGERPSIMPSDVLSEISRIAHSIGEDREEEAKWNKLESGAKTTLSIEDVRESAGRLYVKEPKLDIRIPIELTGGGYQEIIRLLYQLQLDKKIVIFGLEEPEIHLHPHLIRQFFKVLKEISIENQIFIVTHSTLFIDIGELQNVWSITRNKNGESVVKKVNASGELREILFEMGVRPSDIFFANGIVFVEGETEKNILPDNRRENGSGFRRIGVKHYPYLW